MSISNSLRNVSESVLNYDTIIKVLLMDADPQGSLTISLGYREPDKLSVTLANKLHVPSM